MSITSCIYGMIDPYISLLQLDFVALFFLLNFQDCEVRWFNSSVASESIHPNCHAGLSNTVQIPGEFACLPRQGGSPF